VGEQAAKNLCGRFPGLQIVGVEAPSLQEMTAEQQEELAARIRDTRPDLLFVALGQPKGELWLKKYCHSLGVPVSAQIGATLDFIAGRVRRAPRWLQCVGLEWAYRLYQEPRRLFLRYSQNTLFLFRMVVNHRRIKSPRS
jgi:N-acetylglucosaminyldiphosphoundecaprenol N-acetyl-beta-D-mannosaminyltransferase